MLSLADSARFQPGAAKPTPNTILAAVPAHNCGATRPAPSRPQPPDMASAVPTLIVWLIFYAIAVIGGLTATPPATTVAAIVVAGAHAPASLGEWK